MSDVKIVKTAVAGPDWTPLPAHPAASAGKVHRGAVTTGADATFLMGDDSTLVEILVQNAAVRMLQGSAGAVLDDGQTLLPGYHSKSAPAGATLRFRAVSAEATVEILEG